MTQIGSASTPTRASDLAARLAIGASGLTLLALAALHLLSPEFDPSWRAVSEYANGQFGWVLSLMFIAWAVSSWALACALWPRTGGIVARIGVLFLLAAGVGEAMASVFDIKHSLHGLAALIGIPSLTIGAMLISLSLGRSAAWREAKAPLLWTANLTWISLVLMAAAMGLLISTLQKAGVRLSADAAITELPVGVIGVVGWANRLLILAYCLWVATAAWWSIRPGRKAG